MTLDDNIKCYGVGMLGNLYELEIDGSDKLWYYQCLGSIKTGCTLNKLDYPLAVIFDTRFTEHIKVEIYTNHKNEIDTDYLKEYKDKIYYFKQYLKSQAESNSTENSEIEFIII